MSTTETRKETLGELIVQARGSLSQERFAELVGEKLPPELRPPTRFDILRWERNKNEPRLWMLQAIADASGRPLDFFRSTRRHTGAEAA